MLSFPATKFPLLAQATPEQIAHVGITPRLPAAVRFGDHVTCDRQAPLDRPQVYQASGSTMAAFARRERINYATFAGWVAKAQRTSVAKRPIEFAELRHAGGVCLLHVTLGRHASPIERFL